MSAPDARDDHDPDRCTVTLRALDGAPLADDAVRSMVIANAHAIAERQGVRVREVTTTDEAITVILDGVPDASPLIAMGFAAELRRPTTAWYTRKYGVTTLWGEPPDADDDETWKDGATPWPPA